MKKNIIFGAGKKGKRYLHELQKNGIEVDYFCDNNQETWGKEVEGILVISPMVLMGQYRDSNILIANRFHTVEIREQLTNMGISYMEEVTEMFFWNKRVNILGKTEKINIEISDEPYLTYLILCKDGKEISQDTLVGIAEQNVAVPYEIVKCFAEEAEVHGQKIIVILNGSKLQNGSVKELIEAEEKQNAVIGSKTIDRHGNIIQAGYVVRQDGSIEWYGRGRKAIEPEYEYVRQCDALSLNGMLLEKGDIQPLFECLKKYENNLERAISFAVAIKERGIKMVFQPFSIVIEAVSDVQENLTEDNLVAMCRKYAIHRNKQEENLFWQANKGDYSYYTLVADTSIARYDTNAGNRSTYNYIQVFLEMNMWLVYLVDDFVYDYKYVSQFQKQGIFVIYGEAWRNNLESRLIEILSRIEYAFLNRPKIAEKYVDIIRNNSDAIVVHYGHDLHFMRLQREYQVVKNEEILEEAAYFKEIEYGLVPRVDITGYPSILEVALLKKEFPTAEIENFPLYFFDGELSELKEEGREGILFVGGFSHRPNEDAAIWLVQEILPRLRKCGITDKIYLVGSNPTESVLKLQREDVIVTGYVEDEELKIYYNKCFVDILPLRYGAGMKGKLLEAMHQGIPVVTTDIGAEGLEAVGDIIGIGNTAEEIVERVVSLYARKGSLKEIMEAERAYIMEHFSKNRMKTVIENHFLLRNKRSR